MALSWDNSLVTSGCTVEIHPRTEIAMFNLVKITHGAKPNFNAVQNVRLQEVNVHNTIPTFSTGVNSGKTEGGGR